MKKLKEKQTFIRLACFWAFCLMTTSVWAYPESYVRINLEGQYIHGNAQDILRLADVSLGKDLWAERFAIVGSVDGDCAVWEAYVLPDDGYSLPEDRVFYYLVYRGRTGLFRDICKIAGENDYLTVGYTRDQFSRTRAEYYHSSGGPGYLDPPPVQGEAGSYEAWACNPDGQIACTVYDYIYRVIKAYTVTLGGHQHEFFNTFWEDSDGYASYDTYAYCLNQSEKGIGGVYAAGESNKFYDPPDWIMWRYAVKWGGPGTPATRLLPHPEPGRSFIKDINTDSDHGVVLVGGARDSWPSPDIAVAWVNDLRKWIPTGAHAYAKAVSGYSDDVGSYNDIVGWMNSGPAGIGWISTLDAESNPTAATNFSGLLTNRGPYECIEANGIAKDSSSVVGICQHDTGTGPRIAYAAFALELFYND